MGISILDAHPNNECLDMNSNEAWFSFIFCGSRIDKLNLHAYDYYSGEEILSGETVYESVPAMEPYLKMWNGVGNGVRVNVKDFVKNAPIFGADGEYTWRAELIQDVDIANGIYPDNMVYEGVLPGDPNFDAVVDNVQGLDYDKYLPLTPCYKNRIKPPYYLDFMDPKFENTAYDIPVTYDEEMTKSDGTQVTVVRLDTFTSTKQNQYTLARPAIGTTVYVHKKKYYGAATEWRALDNQIFIDSMISALSDVDWEAKQDNEKSYFLKVGSEYFEITKYDKSMGIVTCKDGNKLKNYPAGTHYAIYTSRHWTPYYYFRTHKMPSLVVDAEFHERRRLRKEEYNMTVNCLENTCNGILFKAYLDSDSHSTVKYHSWKITNKRTGAVVFETERTYSQEMDCEVFVPFGETYTGRITVVTQDGITVRGETDYTLPYPPEENNKRLWFGAQQNNYGGIDLAWKYRFYRDNSSLQKITDFEFFRVEKKTGKIKYLGKQDYSPIRLSGSKPALSGSNWYLFDEDCNFNITTLPGARVNMYLVGGGEDGGSWASAPNPQNKSFAVGKDGGGGGYFNKKSITTDDGILNFDGKVAQRNNPKGTSLKVGGATYKCNGIGSERRGAVSNSTMTQSSGSSVIYNHDAENGADGFATPYGVVGSSGGGSAACGNNRTNGGVKTLSVTGITPKMNKGNWLLIDRDSLGGETGEFDLIAPEGATIKMYLVGGGCDGEKWYAQTNDGNSYSWDVNASMCKAGGEGGYVLTKELVLNGKTHCKVSIADVNNTSGTAANVGGSSFYCNDQGSTKTPASKSAAAALNQNGSTEYNKADDGKNGVETPYGYVGSSGGGGGADNLFHIMDKGDGGIGAGDGGSAYSTPPTNGGNATKYGCGGGGGAVKEYSHNIPGAVDRSEPGKGMPGCIIFQIAELADVPCPDPGNGGIGAGDGGFPGEDGENAVNYGCGGGGAGYWAVDSDGNVNYGKVGLGMKGCIIIEIDLAGIEDTGQNRRIYLCDWTAASDKEYRYIITGCNYESAYLGKDADDNDIRHTPEEMIECAAYVDITPHFEDFYLYFLHDADILVKHDYDLENYDVPLTEPMGRYITSRNNPYKAITRHIHTIVVQKNSKAFYRGHTWRIEGDVDIDNVTHNITRNVNTLYAKMPAVTVQPSDYDSFPVSFLLGYLNCEGEDGAFFDFNDQYMFELWKRCVAEINTVMIKDPKGNVWTGSMSDHNYKVEYDVNGMPYIITFDFVQTLTEHNTLVIIADENNRHLITAFDNHLTSDRGGAENGFL